VQVQVASFPVRQGKPERRSGGADDPIRQVEEEKMHGSFGWMDVAPTPAATTMDGF